MRTIIGTGAGKIIAGIVIVGEIITTVTIRIRTDLINIIITIIITVM